MSKPYSITMDGPAASGKTTVGEMLAEELGYLFFDTGLMYRAVTLAALRSLGRVDEAEAVTRLANEVNIDVRPPSQADGRKADVLLDGLDVTWDLRKPEVDGNVSVVSAYPGVRTAMTQQQRRIGQQGRVVMVGRDCGTVVLPEADLKIYLDASVEERARRRFEEQQSRGGTQSYEQVLQAMKKRDEIDSSRAVAPLRPAEDAIIIQTDHLPIESVLQQVKELVK